MSLFVNFVSLVPRFLNGLFKFTIDLLPILDSKVEGIIDRRFYDRLIAISEILEIS